MRFFSSADLSGESTSASFSTPNATNRIAAAAATTSSTIATTGLTLPFLKSPSSPYIAFLRIALAHGYRAGRDLNSKRRAGGQAQTSPHVADAIFRQTQIPFRRVARPA